jgi:Asp-tRNA(Asn)/Glu-tRNA(Gln) amidotransferase A subunit family amidase
MSLHVSGLDQKLKCTPLINFLDDADAIQGAPSGIQLVGKPMKDEELVHVMAIVTEVLKAKS